MIIPIKLQEQEDYKACVDFHGHTCMGLTLGYLASQMGLRYLAERRAEDEEVVCISETDACCCDAIQVMTGCTFGKGNFIYRDIGKMAFTFLSRTSGIGVRLSMKPGVMDVPDEERNLLDKIRSQDGSPEDIKRYEMLHENRSHELFSKGPEGFFSARELRTDMPNTARMAPSRLCDLCGEPVMETKLQRISNQLICRSCIELNNVIQDT